MNAPTMPSAEWRKASHAFWTTPEIQIIRDTYPTGSVDACMPLLPGRSRSSIYQRANALGVRCDHIKPRIRKWYPNEPHIDEQIRFGHQSTPTPGYMQALADRIGRPRWYVTRRARELGLTTPRFAEAPWSEAELAIIDQTAHLRPRSTLLALTRAGFKRTETAVVVKRKRLEIPAPQTPGIYSPGSLATLLGYDPKTPQRWIRNGQLHATERKGITTIRESDIRAFLIAHPMQVDLRKLPLLNRPWFYRVLTPRRTAEHATEQAA